MKNKVVKKYKLEIYNFYMRYDIREYSDKELYEILDFTGIPSDSLLEATLVSRMEKCKKMNTDEGIQMTKFLKDMYEHFFTMSDDEDAEVEGFANYDKESYQHRKDKKKKQDEVKDPEENEDPDAEKEEDTSNVLVTKNPKKKETRTVAMVIDSQYRDQVNSLSTNFIFNLNQTLQNVVSLKFNSIHIPYGWPTINNDYGCNFFTINGFSPGIKNGFHDYKIAIDPATYTAANLITALKGSIKKLKTSYTDVNFGNTDISYNPYNLKTTITLDIQKNYNETYYEIFFPFYEEPYDLAMVRQTNQISSIMGFNQTTYTCFSILSSPLQANGKYATSTETSDPFYTSAAFTLNKSNCFFTIYIYDSTKNDGKFDPDVSNNILQSFPIFISPAYTTFSTIFNAFNDAISSNPKLLSTSGFKLIEKLYTDVNNTSDVPSDTNRTKIYAELNIQLDRTKTITDRSGLKTAVVFPDDSDLITPVWTGVGSCFQFETTTYTLNSILSETYENKPKYWIGSATDTLGIVIKCIDTVYGDPTSNFFEISYNDFYIPITPGFYTIDDFVSELNSEMSKVASSNLNSDGSQIINLPNDATTQLINYFEYDVGNGNQTGAFVTELAFNLELNNFCDQTDYDIDLSSCILSKTFGFPSYIRGNIDLLNSSTVLYSGKVNTLYNISNVLQNNKITMYPTTAIIKTRFSKIDFVVPNGSYNLSDLINAISFSFYSIDRYITTLIDLSYSEYGEYDVSFSLIDKTRNPPLVNYTGILTQNSSCYISNTNPRYEITLDLSFELIATDSFGYTEEEFTSADFKFDLSNSILSQVFGFPKTINGNVGTKTVGPVISPLGVPIYSASDTGIYSDGIFNVSSANKNNKIVLIPKNPRIKNSGNITLTIPDLSGVSIDVICDAITNVFNTPSSINIPNSDKLYDVLNLLNFGSMVCKKKINRSAPRTKNIYIAFTISFSTKIPFTQYNYQIYFKYNSVNQANGEDWTTTPWSTFLNLYCQQAFPLFAYSYIYSTISIYDPYNTLPASQHWGGTYNYPYANPFGDINEIITNLPPVILYDGTTILENKVFVTPPANNYFYIRPVYNPAGGVYSPGGENTIVITVPAGKYTKENLYTAINQIFSKNPITNGSLIQEYNDPINPRSGTYTQFVLNINKTFYAKDYSLVFFDIDGALACGTGSPQLAPWDTTVGWILGYHTFPYYTLDPSSAVPFSSTETVTTSSVEYSYNYYFPPRTSMSSEHAVLYNYDASSNIAIITGSSKINTNVHKYIIVTLDDFVVNRPTSVLTTITGKNTSIQASYSSLYNSSCDPIYTGPPNQNQSALNGYGTVDFKQNVPTEKAIISDRQIQLSQTNIVKLYTQGPYVSDYFGIVPIDANGLNPGDVFTESGSVIQSQVRKYTGPVNISRMAVQLISDKGGFVNLNGDDWSMSITYEQQI